MIEITDIRGAELSFDGAPERVVSLVPSLTETVVELGCGEHIVGCTPFCLGIEGLKDARVIGGPMNPDIDAIRSLNPDLVLAGREENRKEDVERIEEFAKVYVCDPKTVLDVQVLVTDLGIIFDRIDRDWRWSETLMFYQAELGRLFGPELIKFGYLVWWDPPMVAGGNTYISNLLENGPFRNAFGGRTGYPSLTVEELFDQGIDVLFLPSEPYDFSDELISSIRATAGDIRVERIDGRMCGWYGTRTVKGLRYVEELTLRIAPAPE